VEWVKTTAKTLPEAIDLALDNLGVDESEAEIVVLEEPRQGLFGRMRGTARVEARVKPKPIRPKTDRNRNRRNRAEGKGKGRGNDRNRRGGGKQGSGNQGSDRQNAGGQRRGGGQGQNQGGGQSQGGGRGGQRGRQGSGRGRDDEARTDDRAEEVQSGGRSDGGRSENRGDGQRGRNRNRGGSNGGRQSGAKGGGSKKAETKSNEPVEEASVEEVEAHLKTFLTDLNQAFGFDSDVSVDTTDDAMVGRIEGRHGLLVGPKGRTLDAIQELARISCQRAVPSTVRIKVDVGGYRQERVEALAAFAAKAADRAVSDQSEVALEPMSPADRKTIHDALSDDDRVETRSVGSEPRRKVLVVPLESDDVEDVDDDEFGDSESGDAETNGHQVDGDAAMDAEADAADVGAETD
jgi:spoIIIJ-associated protein